MIAGKPVAEIASAIIDYRGKTPPKSLGGVKLLTAKVIKDGTIDESRLEYISEETYAWWMRRGLPQRGDVLLTTEAPLGETAMLRTAEKIALAQRVILLRGDPEQVDQQYLFAALRSPLVQGRLRQRATGTTVLGIKQRELRQVEIPLPPLTVQRKIAAILSAYDDLIENNNRRIKLLEEMARRIYREWFVDFRYPGHETVPVVDSGLGLIPEGWQVGTLDDLVVLQRGFDLPSAQREPGSVPVVTATGRHATHSCAKVSGPGVVTGRSGSLGHVEYVTEDFWPLNTTLWGKEFRRATPELAYYLLRELDLGAYNSGAAVPTLNRNDVKGIPLVQPPRELVRAFSETAKDAFRLQRSYVRANRVARTTRDFLLPRLISGETDVTDLDIAMPHVAL